MVLLQPIQPFQWMGNLATIAIYGIFALDKYSRDFRGLFADIVPGIFIPLPMYWEHL